jgi:hypothetical protein
MRGMGQFQTCLYFVAQAGPTHPDRAVCPWRSGAVLRTAASVQCRGKQSTEAELLRILPPPVCHHAQPIVSSAKPSAEYMLPFASSRCIRTTEETSGTSCREAMRLGQAHIVDRHASVGPEGGQTKKKRRHQPAAAALKTYCLTAGHKPYEKGKGQRRQPKKPREKRPFLTISYARFRWNPPILILPHRRKRNHISSSAAS